MRDGEAPVVIVGAGFSGTMVAANLARLGLDSLLVDSKGRAGLGTAFSTGDTVPVVTLGIVFVVAGFAFKVSAFPFHTWAPDTYEGAPTPITAFLSVASKAAGFVALLSLVFLAFGHNDDVYEPLFWVLSALTMTVGNVIALRQTNVVRLLAYSSVAQAGYILVPFAVAGVEPDPGRRRTMTRLGVVGGILAGVYLIGLIEGPVAVSIEGSHLAYRLGMDHGGLLAGIYAVVACAPPMLSSERRIAAFGLANLVAVVALVWIESSALTSLWCAWAAVTSVAIAAHLRRAHREPGIRVHPA